MKKIVIFFGFLTSVLIVVVIFLIIKKSHNEMNNSTQLPTKQYLKTGNQYLVLKNNNVLNVTRNIKDATPISVSTYKIPDTPSAGIFHMIKTEDGRNFIASNNIMASNPNVIEYTNDVILNYLPAGRNGTFSSLYLLKQDDGSYFVKGIGCNDGIASMGGTIYYDDIDTLMNFVITSE